MTSNLVLCYSVHPVSPNGQNFSDDCPNFAIFTKSFRRCLDLIDSGVPSISLLFEEGNIGIPIDIQSLSRMVESMASPAYPARSIVSRILRDPSDHMFKAAIAGHYNREFVFRIKNHQASRQHRYQISARSKLYKKCCTLIEEKFPHAELELFVEIPCLDSGVYQIASVFAVHEFRTLMGSGGGFEPTLEYYGKFADYLGESERLRDIQVASMINDIRKRCPDSTGLIPRGSDHRIWLNPELQKSDIEFVDEPASDESGLRSYWEYLYGNAHVTSNEKRRLLLLSMLDIEFKLSGIEVTYSQFKSLNLEKLEDWLFTRMTNLRNKTLTEEIDRRSLIAMLDRA